METTKYKVKRNDIYIGEVIKTRYIKRYTGDSNLYNIEPGQLYSPNWYSYRSILFVLTKNKMANDLLYNTDNYPILNITDDNVFYNLENDIVIKDAYNLGDLLEYYCFDDYLSYTDIVDIRKTFFSGRFAKDHCELFGWKEIDYNQVREKGDLKSNFMNGNRIFICTPNNTLPRRYLEILDLRGDKTLKEAIEEGEKMNAFKPNRKEGPVKKLKRF